MHFLSGRPRLSSLGIGIAAYVIGTVFAAAVTTHAIVRVGAAVLEQFAPAADQGNSRTKANWHHLVLVASLEGQ